MSCVRRVAPSRNGSSQPRSCASAACEKSGQSPRSLRSSLRTNSQRARKSRASSSQGSASMPSDRTPSSMAAALAARGTSLSGFSSISSSSSRITRRATTASVRSSQASSSARRRSRREVLQQIRLVERRGKPDLRLALAIVEIHGHDELLARDRLRGGEQRAAPIAELVTRLAAGPAARDPVRIRQA